MSDIQKKFYVLRAISGKENKVREYLEAELKIRIWENMYLKS